jgi:DNA polymerase
MGIRCPACPGNNNCIAAEGPTDSDLLFIGEAPGIQENKSEKIFIGKTGEELSRGYLPLAGLRRDSVRIINAIACLPPGPKGKLDSKKQKDLDLLYGCASTHLYPEIQCNDYKLLVPMGAFACRALDPSIDLEIQHGIPCETPFGLAFPMYHPSSGLHEPKKMLLLRNDWDRLRRYLRGTLRIPRDEYRNREDYRHLESPAEVKAILRGREYEPLAGDTETVRGGGPFCLTFSVTPGTGYLIRADDGGCIEAFNECVQHWRGPILFHNWLFDWGITKKMGIHFPIKKIKDTMVKSFHLGNLPQGLKALAYRELGMQMQDFSDLVKPYSTKLCLDYLREAHMVDWPKPEVQMVRNDDGSWRKYKPHSMTTKLKVFFTYYAKNPDKCPMEAWDNWQAEQHMIEEEVGPWPGMCITHAPFDRVIRYACRDADATLRLWPIIEKMQLRVRKMAQERWND